MNCKFNRGASLVELLIAIGVAAVVLPAVLTGLVTSREGKAQQLQRMTAIGLLREEQESLRSVREKGWKEFTADSGGTAYPSGTILHTVRNSGTNYTWSLAAGEESLTGAYSGFRRKFVISDVYRSPDINGPISASGTNDPSTKKVVVTVSWDEPNPSSIFETMYMTRYLENLAIVDTLKADFDAGNLISLKSQNTGGSPTDGEFILSQTGGFGDWCTPSLTFSSLDLPKSGVANAISAIQGKAAAGTGDNSSGVSFASVTMTDPAYPTAPVASIDGTFDGYKTNSVFTETDYAYLGTDNNGKEIVLIDLRTKDGNGKYPEAGYFNAPGNGNGDSVFTLGNVGYMASGNKFYTFDISNKTRCKNSGCPRLNTGSDLTLSGTAKKIMVNGNFAYVATNASSNQLQIISVLNPASPSITASVSVSGGSGRDVFINGNASRAYMATAKSDAQREFFIIRLDTRTVLGSYDTGSMDPKGVIAVSGARAVIVGSGGTEYQVIDTSTENPQPPGTLLPACGPGLNIDSGVNGISTVFTAAERAYSYIITGDASSEYKIIEGGPGGSGGNYVPSGTFTSRALPIPNPTTDPTAFNRFTANFSQGEANGVQIFVAVANPVAGLCAGALYNFVGPGGGAGAFQSSDASATSLTGAIPFGTFGTYLNPGKCLKYKVVLTTSSSTVTPVFNDMTINYSP